MSAWQAQLIRHYERLTGILQRKLSEHEKPKPKGYEHLTWPMIKAIGGTCSTPASRIGKTQDQVFLDEGKKTQ